MPDDQQEHGNGFWIGLAVGGLLGAVGSYLATTDEKQRKLLIAKGKQLLENLEEFGESAIEKGEEIKEVVVDKAQKVEKIIEKKAPEVQEMVQEKVEDASEDIEEIAKEAIAKIASATQSAQKTGAKRFFSKGRALK